MALSPRLNPRSRTPAPWLWCLLRTAGLRLRATADGPMRPPSRLQIKWHFAVIRTDCTAQRLPRLTWQTLALGIRLQTAFDVTCMLLSVSLHPDVCAQYIMKVLAAEWSKRSRCQTLTSHKFSWPSHRRYLKCGSISQISHVACICTKMPPKTIGCLEMDVNTNLHAIYPSPFGCLCSVTALKGHEKVLNLSWVAFTVRSLVVPRGSCVREWRKKTMGSRDFAIRCAQTLTIKLIVNLQQKLENNCGLRWGVLVPSHSCRGTKRNLNIVRAC